MINVKAKVRVQIMGILNITPDSFFDGGKFLDLDKAVKKALEIATQGADILDVGAESTAPRNEETAVEVELSRLKDFFSLLGRDFPLPISIDSQRIPVVRHALLHGAKWINDNSGFEDPEMREIAAHSGAKLCVMHRPKTRRMGGGDLHYEKGIITHLKAWFYQRIELLLRSGVSHENIVLDPGIGFGKSVEDQIKIYRHLGEFKTFGCPLLVGGSRKQRRMLGKEVEDLLPATLVLHTIAAQNGANFLRVHDVAPHKDLSRLNELLEKNF